MKQNFICKRQEFLKVKCSLMCISMLVICNWMSMPFPFAISISQAFSIPPLSHTYSTIVIHCCSLSLQTKTLLLHADVSYHVQQHLRPCKWTNIPKYEVCNGKVLVCMMASVNRVSLCNEVCNQEGTRNWWTHIVSFGGRQHIFTIGIIFAHFESWVL
jgi:hypothetical protein